MNRNLKLLLVVLCGAAIVGELYYMFFAKPFVNVWNEGKAIMSGQLQPTEEHPLWFHYRSIENAFDEGATKVELEIRRSLMWHFGNKGRITVNYKQKIYDSSGNLMINCSSAEVWILAKVGQEWKITDVIVGPA